MGDTPLPNELLLEILLPTCITSPTTYHSLLQVSRRIHDIVQSHCLSVIPVVLSDSRSILSFSHLLHSYPGISPQVHYLWVSEHDERTNRIVRACKNIVSLACVPRTLISICGTVEFRHTQLRELYLFMGIPDWKTYSHYPFTQRLSNQITHLQVEGGIPLMPRTNWFQRVRKLALTSIVTFNAVVNGTGSAGLLEIMPSLEHIVVADYIFKSGTTKNVWDALEALERSADDPNDDYTSLLSPWFSLLQKPSWDPVKMWCKRVQDGQGIWGAHDDNELFTTVPPNGLSETKPLIRSLQRKSAVESRKPAWEAKALWSRRGSNLQ